MKTEQPRITSPRSAAAYLLPKISSQETFGLLALDSRGNLIGEQVLSEGVKIAPREFFRAALSLGKCFSAIAYHSHPQGCPLPGKDESSLVARLRSAGEALGIPLSDYLIIALESFYSFRAVEGWEPGTGAMP